MLNNKQIRDYRLLRGLTQKEVAEFANIAREEVVHIELGQQKITRNMNKRLINAINDAYDFYKKNPREPKRKTPRRITRYTIAELEAIRDGIPYHARGTLRIIPKRENIDKLMIQVQYKNHDFDEHIDLLKELDLWEICKDLEQNERQYKELKFQRRKKYKTKKRLEKQRLKEEKERLKQEKEKEE